MTQQGFTFQSQNRSFLRRSSQSISAGFRVVMFCAESSAVFFLSLVCFRLVHFIVLYMCSLYICTRVLHTVYSVNEQVISETFFPANSDAD